MEFAIFVWLASVIPAIKILLLVPASLIVLYCFAKIMFALMNLEDTHYIKKYAPEEYTKAMCVLEFKWMKWPAIFVTMTVVIATLLPTERTMYMMAAAYGSQQMIQSEAADKVLKIVNGKLDEYLVDMEKSVKEGAK